MPPHQLFAWEQVECLVEENTLEGTLLTSTTTWHPGRWAERLEVRTDLRVRPPALAGAT